VVGVFARLKHIFATICETRTTGIADAAATPTSIEELLRLPVGLKVTHSPKPSLATETPDRLWRYTWFFETTVQAIDSDVRVTEFGAYGLVGRKWLFGNYTGKPFDAADFAEWYCCPDAFARKGKDYTDTENWSANSQLIAGTSRSYYIGVDAIGRRVKGEAIVERSAEIDPRRPRRLLESVG
jgi:hypothetical protein